MRYNENDSHLRQRVSKRPVAATALAMENPMRLSELPRRTAAVVLSVDDSSPDDPISRRLRELGFVVGEPVQIIAHGPFGKDPLVAQVGYTRFALRRTEADRVNVELASASVTPIAAAGDSTDPAQADARRSAA